MRELHDVENYYRRRPEAEIRRRKRPRHNRTRRRLSRNRKRQAGQLAHDTET